jgi:hypothetical protein
MAKTVKGKTPRCPVTDQDAALQGNQGQDQVEMSEVRLEKIKAVMTEALAKADPTESAMGAITSDMMDLAFRIKEVLNESLSDAATTVAKLQQLTPTIEMFIKLTRQIARYVEVRRLLAKPQ